MKPRRWTKNRPTERGIYRIRDRVFGWNSKALVILMEDGLYVCPQDPDGDVYKETYIPVSAMGDWIEWRKK